ncbi:hypothetical protein BGW80DRAFT_144969 [Lactifluus volemus]|nr:hypothetical protein BGW80DRAFT_144969 [Lactifluus volemus]
MTVTYLPLCLLISIGPALLAAIPLLHPKYSLVGTQKKRQPHLRSFVNFLILDIYSLPSFWIPSAFYILIVDLVTCVAGIIPFIVHPSRPSFPRVQ